MLMCLVALISISVHSNKVHLLVMEIFILYWILYLKIKGDTLSNITINYKQTQNTV